MATHIVVLVLVGVTLFRKA